IDRFLDSDASSPRSVSKAVDLLDEPNEAPMCQPLVLVASGGMADTTGMGRSEFSEGTLLLGHAEAAAGWKNCRMVGTGRRFVRRAAPGSASRFSSQARPHAVCLRRLVDGA